MAEFGDIANEWKQAKTPEKVLIVGGIVGVLGIAWYLHSKSSSSQPTSGSSPSDTSAGAQTGGIPTVGANQTPILPPGVNPVYDPNGNLVAFQNPGGSTGGPLIGPGGSTTSPAPSSLQYWYANLIGQIPYGAKITPGGIDQPTGYQRFWYSPHNYFLAPQGTTFAPGGQGRIWLNLPGKPTNQQGVLITGQGQPVPQPTKTAQPTQLAQAAASVRH